MCCNFTIRFRAQNYTYSTFADNKKCKSIPFRNLEYIYIYRKNIANKKQWIKKSSIFIYRNDEISKNMNYNESVEISIEIISKTQF